MYDREIFALWRISLVYLELDDASGASIVETQNEADMPETQDGDSEKRRLDTCTPSPLRVFIQLRD